MSLYYWGGVIFTLLAILLKRMSMPNPYDIQRVFYYMGFYAMGWYIAQNTFSTIRVPRFFTSILFILLSIFACSFKAIQWNPLIYIFIAVTGIFFSWGFCQEVRRNRTFSAFLSYVGKHTMPIFVWHVFCFKCLELLLAKLGLIEYMSIGWNGSYANNPFVLVLLYASVGILLPIEFCRIKNKLIGK